MALAVAENFWFVFGAYFLAIAAWYAVSGHLFISNRWVTVVEARRRGKRTLFILALPLAYLAVYIYFKAKTREYKEMCLTLVAFVVALSLMLQTVLGLWQLHIFKHWAMRAICSMQSLGYRAQLREPEEEDFEEEDSKQAAASEPAEEEEEEEEEEKGPLLPHVVADSIIVNDTIVDNNLSEGNVPFELQFFTQQQVQRIFDAKILLKRLPLTVFFALRNTVCLAGILWPVFFSKSAIYSKPSSMPFLRPRDPEELWLRWATVLISCAFPNWVIEMKKLRCEEATGHDSEYEEYRDRFAEELVRGAALHCERGPTKTSCGIFHRQKFPKLIGGTFSKQEFLKVACTTGRGLPFEAPHRNTTSRKKEKLVYSYAKYRSKLELARRALPVNEGELLTGIGVEDLEWLSIILTVEDWGIGSAEEDKDDKDAENGHNVQPKNPDSSGIAVENLCHQLGFPGKVKGFADRFAAPFLEGIAEATLWGNENILTLSVHVDNWLALLSGEHMAYMIEQIPSMKEGFLFNNKPAKNNKEKEPVGRKRQVRKKPPTMADEAARYEKQRRMFQLSVAEPEYSHFDQSITFLGCSMENLRRSLAKWVRRNPDDLSTAWAPTLGADALKGGKLEFDASKDFQLYLSKVSSMKCWSQRYLQMRLLWELQNNLHNTLSGGAVAPNQTEAILLCILSFPAIRLIPFESDEESVGCCTIKMGEETVPFRHERCHLSLRAVFGPQDVYIIVSFAKQANGSGMAVKAKLCGDDVEKGKEFVWQAWRDAFVRSLQCNRQWQVDHQLAFASLPVTQCTGAIAEAVSETEATDAEIAPVLKVWKGWPPHRQTLAADESTTGNA